MKIARDTCVVVPCYNEAARLDPDAFVEVLEAQPKLRFVLVDDGSDDGTRDVLEALQARRPTQVSVLGLAHNRGKAEAVRRGVLAAFASGAEVTGYWDADLATPLSAIAVLYDALEHPPRDIVLGSRVLLLGREIERSVYRHYIGRVFATLASMALDLRVYDTQCGAKLLRATAEVHEAFERPFELEWSFDVELLARLMASYGSRFHERCVEVPLAEWRDAKGSKITWRQVPKIASEMLKLAPLVAAQRRRR